MLQYRIKHSYRAQNANVQDQTVRNDQPRYAVFGEGQQVWCRIYTPLNPELKVRYAPSIIVNNAYIIPLSIAEKLTFNQYGTDGAANPIPEASKIMSGTLSEKVTSSGKAYKTGIVIGGLSGAALGMLMHWSVWKFAIGGALIGGFLAAQVSDAKNQGADIKFIG